MKFLLAILYLTLNLTVLVTSEFERLDLTVLSATLSSTQNAFVKVYGIDAPIQLNLPIKLDDLQPYPHVYYLTPVVYKHNYESQNPAWTWKNQFGFTRNQFSESSNIVIELWNQEQNNSLVQHYLGGTKMRIGELERLPKTVNLVLQNQSGSKSPGSITVTWNN